MTKPKHADDGMYCPLWRKQCVKVCHTCEFWAHVRGKNPQTGQEMDHWACTHNMLTYLSIENTMVARQTTASVDELRKEVQAGNDKAISGAIGIINEQVRATTELLSQASQKLIEAT